MKDKKPFLVTADWKDTEGLIDLFAEAIKMLGGHVYEDPNCEGTDQYGFIISPVKMKKKEIKQFSDEQWPVIELE